MPPADSTLFKHARRIKAAGDVPVVVDRQRRYPAGMKAGFEVLTPTDVLARRQASLGAAALPAHSSRQGERSCGWIDEPTSLILFGVDWRAPSCIADRKPRYLLDTIRLGDFLGGANCAFRSAVLGSRSLAPPLQRRGWSAL